MKNDLDLIRLLLIEIEKRDEMFGSSELAVHGYDSGQIAYHVGLLKDAGFLETSGNSVYTQKREKQWVIQGITFAGHDYLDAVRHSRIWQKVKDAAAQGGMALTITLAKQLAEQIGAQVLGMVS